MNPVVRTSVVMAGAAAIALAGSVYAFAGWNSVGAPTVLSMRTLDMPVGNAPSVAKSGKQADIRWVGNKMAPGVKVQSYVVTRFGPGDPVVVCHRVTTTSCKDKLVPGGTWTWRVQPVFETWIGDHSTDSVALTFNGPPPTAAELVSSTSPAAPAATSGAPTARTAPGGDTKAVTSPPAAAATTAKPPAVTDPEPEEPDAPPPVSEESSPVDPTPSVTPAEDRK